MKLANFMKLANKDKLVSFRIRILMCHISLIKKQISKSQNLGLSTLLDYYSKT